jgi:hypothetical protein
VDDPRPILTLVSGSDAYHRAAQKYWKHRADGVIRRNTLEAMLDYVAGVSEGPLAELNIVSHANSCELIIPMFFSKGPKVPFITARALGEHGDDARLQTPGQDVLDGNSRVVFRSCMLGENLQMLNALKRVFGGGATVYAPKYIQWYESWGIDAYEYFRHCWWANVASKKVPSFKVAREKLMEKYPGINDEKEWGLLLKGKGERQRKDWLLKYTLILPYGYKPKHTKKEYLDNGEENWPEPYDPCRGSFEDWVWTVGKPKYFKKDKEWRVNLSARRYRVDVRRPLRDAQGNLIVPNLNDRDHYGVST